ncbi:Probable serine/threonine-protein kinase DDB_G0280133 [Durusdinium trenchii]|uniref:Probable serine/threonine-protein kinase DDB_G0280133 n=1 Tax=Durusdinium trenchii TaxID=1381693 RepID=A0ABP0RFQ2_9DINO
MDFNSGSSGSAHGLGMLEMARKGLYGAFYKICNNSVTAERFHYFSVIVMTMQLLYFPVSLQLFASDHPVVMDILGPVLRLTSFGFLPFDSIFGSTAMVLLSCSVTAFMVIGLALLGFDELHDSTRYSFLASFVGVVLRLNQTVLQIPVLAILLRVVRCDFDAPGSPLSCSSGVHVVMTAVSLLLALVHVVVTTVNALVVIQQSPYTPKGRNNKLFAAPHGRVECIATLTRAFCTCIFVALTPQSFDEAISSSGNGVGQEDFSLSTVLAVVCCLSGVLLTGSYMYFLPFYMQRWNVFTVACYSIFSWGSVSAIVASAVPNRQDQSAFMLLVVPAIFVCTTAVSLVHHRINRLRNSSPSLLMSSPYLTEVHIRLVHEDPSAEEEFKFTGAAEEAFRQALETFPDSSFLALLVSLLATTAGNRMIFALNLLTRVRQHQLSLDLDFVLFCHNKRNSESHSTSSGSISFVALDQHQSDARRSLVNTLKFTSGFWKMVTRGGCTLSEVLQMGSKVHMEASKCRFHLQRLRKLSRSNREGLKLHAQYYYYVMNDRETALALERELTSSNHQEEGHGSAVCTISGNQNTLGQILEVSDAMCAMFGYNKGEMVGRNVNMLCPSPFQEVHDQFLLQFISIDSEFTTKTRRIFGMHAKGHIIATDFEVTPSTNANSELVLIGRFKKAPKMEGVNMLMVDSKTGFVTSTTAGASEIMGFDEGDVFSMNLHISDVLVDFYDESQTPQYLKQERTVNLHGNAFKVKTRQVDIISKPEGPTEYHVSVLIVSFVLSNDIFAPLSVADTKRSAARFGQQKPAAESIIGDISEGEFDSDLDNLSDDGVDTEEPAPVLSGRGSAKLRGSGRKREKSNASDRELPGQALVGGGGAGSRKGRPTSVASGNSRRSRGGGPGAGVMSRLDQSSQGGGSSSLGSNINSRTVEIAQIQKKIMRKLSRRDPQLQAFRKQARRFVFFFVVFVVTNTIILTRMYKSFGDEVETSQWLRELSDSFTKATLLVMFHTEGQVLVNGTAFDRHPLDTEQWLLENADSMKQLHGQSLDFIESLGDERLLEKVHSPVVSTTLDGIDFRNVSLHVAALEFVSHILNHVHEDKLECRDSCHFLLNTGSRDALRVTQDLTALFHVVEEEGLQALQLYDLIVLCSVSVILLFFFVLGYVPVFKSHDRRKSQVGKAFFAIPESMCKKLLTRSERRMTQIQMQRDVDLIQEEEDKQPVEGEQPNSPGSPMAEPPLLDNGQALGASANPLSGENSLENAKWTSQRAGMAASLKLPEAAPSKPTGSAKVAPMKEAQKSKKAGRKIKQVSLPARIVRTLATNLHMALTFWIVLGYFAMQAVMDHAADVEVLKASKIANAAGAQFALLSALHLWATFPVHPVDWNSHETRAIRIERLETILSEVRRYESIISFGDEEIGVEPFQDTSGPQFSLFFENACDEDCEAFLNNATGGDATVQTRFGLEHLRHGLSLMLDRYLDNVDVIAEAEKAFLDTPSDANRVALEGAKLILADLEPFLLFENRIQESVENFSKDVRDFIDNIVRTKIISSVIFVVAIFIGHVVSLNAFASMDKDLKKNQTLLLMLPFEVFERVPQMIKLIND